MVVAALALDMQVAVLVSHIQVDLAVAVSVVQAELLVQQVKLIQVAAAALTMDILIFLVVLVVAV
jgi:hypothetical protein